MRPLALLAFASLLGGCDGGSSDTGVPPGHVLFHFKMTGDTSGIQDFRAATNDPDVINGARAQIALPPQDRRLFIIGAIDRGNAGHNLSWNWHFVPGQWQLTEVAIELCDGNAVLVSQAVDYWVDEVGQFCPWGAQVTEEVGGAP